MKLYKNVLLASLLISIAVLTQCKKEEDDFTVEKVDYMEASIDSVTEFSSSSLNINFSEEKIELSAAGAGGFNVFSFTVVGKIEEGGEYRLGNGINSAVYRSAGSVEYTAVKGLFRITEYTNTENAQVGSKSDDEEVKEVIKRLSGVFTFTASNGDTLNPQSVLVESGEFSVYLE